MGQKIVRIIVRIKQLKVRINTDKLNLSQKKIVEFILENGKVTNKDVQRLLGVKDSRALKILRFIRLLIYVYIQHRLMVATICSMCYHLELCERL